MLQTLDEYLEANPLSLEQFIEERFSDSDEDSSLNHRELLSWEPDNNTEELSNLIDLEETLVDELHSNLPDGVLLSPLSDSSILEFRDDF